MAEAETYTCVICGRSFHQGQGIVIRRGDIVLAFHSSRCAAKFLRLLMERADADCLSRPSQQLLRELQEALRSRVERSRKVVA